MRRSPLANIRLMHSPRSLKIAGEGDQTMKTKLLLMMLLSTLILAACGAPSTAPIVPTA
jgi:uncharacterized lipoprotein YajG